MLNLKGEIGELKTTLVETGVDVGPAIYLARTFNTDIDSVVKFFIFILIFVFDPLAVMLVIAFNQALILREVENSGRDASPVKSRRKSWWEMYNETKGKILQRENIDVVPQDDGEVNIIKEKEKKGIIERFIGKGGVKIR